MTDNTAQRAPRPRPMWKTASLWGLQILAAVTFLAAGGAKLAGADAMVTIFDKIGIGQWFRYLTGVLEVGGAALILFSRTAVYGALLLACVMVGAVVTHLAVIGGNPIPAIVLLGVTMGVAWLRRGPRSLRDRGGISSTPGR